MPPLTHVPAYGGPFTLQSNLSASVVLMTPAQMTAIGVATGNGLLMGRIVDPTGTSIIGARIAVTSRSGASYTVQYLGEGSVAQEELSPPAFL